MYTVCTQRAIAYTLYPLLRQLQSWEWSTGMTVQVYLYGKFQEQENYSWSQKVQQQTSWIEFDYLIYWNQQLSITAPICDNIRWVRSRCQFNTQVQYNFFSGLETSKNYIRCIVGYKCWWVHPHAHAHAAVTAKWNPIHCPSIAVPSNVATLSPRLDGDG